MLNTYRSNRGNGRIAVFQIRVQGLYPQIYCLGLVVLQQIELIGAKIARCEPVEKFIKLFYRIIIALNRIKGQILLQKIRTKVIDICRCHKGFLLGIKFMWKYSSLYKKMSSIL